ncbi:MAG: HAD-IA family hydrolase [Rhodocyclaceae bacterium]|jgi:phosphoglycolate phosphatase|nr:HAD-IA family hydrolase [Rhodocyclaceae bacterium]MDO9600690.1 HAD-IA family hydrolase [Rhodocyclaceae bacterium]MDP2107589.1 HAD-IA family hydrolase [Rhodocyclaceae bacterium]MDP2196839.1 HAD-IA family hydrolase [Rhodocyclaceae bacterium]
MKRYELIVFDWDGTLMDSAGAIAQSVQAAACDLGLEPPSDERARHIIGLGLGDALRYALPDLEQARYEDLTARYRHHYLSRDHELLLFSGVDALMQELARSGRWLGVATGKSRLGLDRALRHSGLGGHFHATRCADECHSKPHPQMLDELMAEFAVSPATTLMIGDTTHDLLMAQNAGVDAVAVSYGAHPRAMLEAAAPLYCAASVEDLTAWLAENS